MKRLAAQFLATLVVVLAHFIWWIAAAVALITLAALLLVVWFHSAHRVDVRARRRAELAAHAGQQHQWVLQGDERGVYGPDGAQLMHYIRSADQPTRAAYALAAVPQWV
jgi:ABC-type transport system involved in cytochrome bd biosynthesis fused ATPase/permease subunit